MLKQRKGIKEDVLKEMRVGFYAFKRIELESITSLLFSSLQRQSWYKLSSSVLIGYLT